MSRLYSGCFGRLRSNSGQALVEFIFIFLIFFSLFWMVLQIYWMANVKQMTNVAAHAACRTYVTTYSRDKAKEAALVYLSREFLNMNIYWFNIEYSPEGDPGFGNKMKVKVKVRYRPVMLPLPKFMFPKFLTFTSSCSMMME